MKRGLKFLSVILGCAILCSSAVACGPERENKGDKLYQVNVNVWQSGFGEQWINDTAKEYNETVLKDSLWEINVVPQKILADSVVNSAASGSNEFQIFLNGGNELRNGIEKGYFEDLSDILTEKVDGESGGTVKDKISDYNGWKELFSKSGQGLYALPYTHAFLGMIIDHQDFIDNNYYTFASSADASELTTQGITYSEESGKLKFVSSTNPVNYKSGDLILSKGKDGKFGTYDDGQPTTVAEFDALIKKIGNDAFIWGGGVDSYMDMIFDAIFAQYSGMDDYKVYYNYDSKGREIEFFDGTSKAITLTNGYEVNKMAGLKVGYEFFETYFDYTNDITNKYIHPLCENTSSSQYDGQSYFLRGYRNTQKNPKSSILMDGIWWEKEATTTLNELDKVNRGYGDREYRFLLLPDFTGQKNDKTCFSVNESGTISVPKDSNTERLKQTKEFLKYILRDETFRYMTRTTGAFLGYDYELTAEDKAQMTPFQRNAYEIFSDKDNIELVTRKLEGIKSPLSYATSFGYQHYYLPKVNGIFQVNTLKAVLDNDVTTILNSLKDTYSSSIWADYIADAQRQGFFQGV